MEINNPTGHKVIEVKDDSLNKIIVQDLKSGSREFDLEVILVGDGVSVDIVGRAQSSGKDKKTWKVRLCFQGRDQVATLDLKGTAEDESSLEFDGAGVLESSSSQASIEIEEKIVLFDQAKGKCLPVLTVKTDQVKSASHAASVAPFDDEMRLYLQSRGIDGEDADALLKSGFLES